MRLPTAILNRKGFTLVELVVAIAILMVGMMGLMEAINVATATNVRNVLRQEAVQLGDQKLNESRALAFDNITSHTALRTTTRTVRTISKPFSYQRTVTNLPTGAVTPTSKRVQVTVTWQFKGVTNTHIVNTVIAAN